MYGNLFSIQAIRHFFSYKPLGDLILYFFIGEEDPLAAKVLKKEAKKLASLIHLQHIKISYCRPKDEFYNIKGIKY